MRAVNDKVLGCADVPPGCGLTLTLADLILKGVAEIVGCRVDTFMVLISDGRSLHIDVHDTDFGGAVPFGRLGMHLCAVIGAATGLAIGEIGRCASEGGTITIRVSVIENDELLFEMGV